MDEGTATLVTHKKDDTDVTTSYFKQLDQRMATGITNSPCMAHGIAFLYCTLLLLRAVKCEPFAVCWMLDCWLFVEICSSIQIL